MTSDANDHSPTPRPRRIIGPVQNVRQSRSNRRQKRGPPDLLKQSLFRNQRALHPRRRRLDIPFCAGRRRGQNRTLCVSISTPPIWQQPKIYLCRIEFAGQRNVGKAIPSLETKIPSPHPHRTSLARSISPRLEAPTAINGRRSDDASPPRRMDFASTVFQPEPYTEA
jgi:hypothetical protein